MNTSPPSMEPRIRIMVVDDNQAHLRIIESYLESASGSMEFPFEVKTFDHPAKAIKAINRENYRPDLAILDLIMPGIAGPRLAKIISAAGLDTAVLFFSAADRVEAQRMISANVGEYNGMVRRYLSKEAPEQQILMNLRYLWWMRRNPTIRTVDEATCTTLLSIDRVGRNTLGLASRLLAKVGGGSWEGGDE